jgi:hypothetical protein
LFGLFLLLVLLVLNGSTVLIYDQVRGTIEQELGERLLGVASATAAGLDPAAVRVLGAPADSLTAGPIRERLARIAFDTEIGDLYLFDRDRRHLIDAADRLAPGFANPSLDLHYAAVTAALAGVPASSALYRVEGVYLKTAFAPVFDETGAVVAVVAAEGGATFFRGLWSLRRQVLLSGAAGMLVVVGLAALFYRWRPPVNSPRSSRTRSAIRSRSYPRVPSASVRSSPRGSRRRRSAPGSRRSPPRSRGSTRSSRAISPSRARPSCRAKRMWRRLSRRS